MTEQPPVNFFDIDSTLPGAKRSWSPNTLKTRMILNYKGIPYTQSWISYPDIAPLLSGLAIPPHPQDAAPVQYTLPAICHQSVKSNPYGALMDSLPIAAHLEEAFPSTRPIFPSGAASYVIAIAANKLMRDVASAGPNLIAPKVCRFLDPRGQGYFRKTRSAWACKPFDEICPTDPDEIKKMRDAMKKEIIPVVQMLKGGFGNPGPFIEGENPSYADFIIISHMAWFERANRAIFDELMGVGDGEIKRLWDLCLPWMEGQGEERAWEIP